MKTNLRWVAAATVAATLLGGCWDDDDDDVVGGGGGGGSGTSVPADAGASVPNYLAFLTGLSATDETSEPLGGVDAFVAPTDDTGDPGPL